MRIGDTVNWNGHSYLVRGFEPIGVPNGRVDLEDLASGRWIQVRLADLDPDTADDREGVVGSSPSADSATAPETGTSGQCR